ncbi:calponin homology domain-containing protein [Phyllosticta citribraziliensis]|uniref:Calponin homology domain-containing protein n=1 Tax=Phyllosticta citribraziliensis TaxID=989973 RepID=A0ABR1LA94_9PEZI
MGESRQELLAWVNNLLQLNLTKVEQCGSGAPYCQIFDSIFLDVPMSRVKFNVNTEYQYLQNFKVLQNTFQKHGVDRPIHVESLVKCKMQDNLDFLQFSKRYWDQNFPGGDYDAVARRKASGAPAGGAPAAAPRTASSTARRPAAVSNTGATRARTPQSSAQTTALTQENSALKETVAGLERERDFYFSKLRDIELLIQNAMETDPELEKEEGILKQIQTILYSTEEGFEIPAEAEAEEVEEETF